MLGGARSFSPPPRKGEGEQARRCLWLVAVLLVAFLWPVSPLAAAEPVVAKEYQVKAAFLFNFTKFVEWPAEKFLAPDDPIVIGVLGRNPFGTALEETVKGKSVNGRALHIKVVRTVAEIKGVHVLFVAASEDHRMGEVGSALQAGRVLGVGESAAFLACGGVIRFVLEGAKLRFDIDMGSADLAQVTVRAQLQDLARDVKKKPAANVPRP